MTVNHARNLLLNASAAQRTDLPGEEFVPADYRPKSLPTFLQTVRRYLFGTKPDRLYMNFRLQQYLTLLHSTELEEFVLDLDSRVTYWPAGQDLFSVAAGTVVTQVAGPAARTYVLGELAPDHRQGRLQAQWSVEVVGEDARIRQHTPPRHESTQSLVGETLSAPLSLQGETLRLRIDLTPPVLNGARWEITATARPDYDLGDVLAQLRLGLGEVNQLRLFGVAPREPYKTFRNLWQDHTELPYQLGGLLLATIYRTHEQPVA